MAVITPITDFYFFYAFWQYLEKELGIESLRTMKRIKAALDPNNIMNPGKLIPPQVCI
jgi:D-lactate dehydrogenase (cytochrome)